MPLQEDAPLGEEQTLGSEEFPGVTRLDVDALLRLPPPPIDYVWEGLVQTGGATQLHSLGGLGKSLITLMLSRRALAGVRTWAGRLTSGMAAC